MTPGPFTAYTGWRAERVSECFQGKRKNTFASQRWLARAHRWQVKPNVTSALLHLVHAKDTFIWTSLFAMSLGLREAHRAGKVRSSCCWFLLTAWVKSYVFGKPSSPVQRQTEVWDRAGLEQHKIWVVALELLALPLCYPGLVAAICFAGACPCPASWWFWFHSRWSWPGREQFAQLDFLLKNPNQPTKNPHPTQHFRIV